MTAAIPPNVFRKPTAQAPDSNPGAFTTAKKVGAVVLSLLSFMSFLYLPIKTAFIINAGFIGLYLLSCCPTNDEPTARSAEEPIIYVPWHQRFAETFPTFFTRNASIFRRGLDTLPRQIYPFNQPGIIPQSVPVGRGHDNAPAFARSDRSRLLLPKEPQVPVGQGHNFMPALAREVQVDDDANPAFARSDRSRLLLTKEPQVPVGQGHNFMPALAREVQVDDGANPAFRGREVRRKSILVPKERPLGPATRTHNPLGEAQVAVGQGHQPSVPVLPAVEQQEEAIVDEKPLPPSHVRVGQR